jgi:hypothetical protein
MKVGISVLKLMFDLPIYRLKPSMILKLKSPEVMAKLLK